MQMILLHVDMSILYWCTFTLLWCFRAKWLNQTLHRLCSEELTGYPLHTVTQPVSVHLRHYSKVVAKDRMLK